MRYAPVQHQTCHFGDLFQCVETIRQTAPYPFHSLARRGEETIHSHGCCGHRDDFSPFWCLSPESQSYRPLFSPRVGPVAVQHTEVELLLVERWATLAMTPAGATHHRPLGKGLCRRWCSGWSVCHWCLAGWACISIAFRYIKDHKMRLTRDDSRFYVSARAWASRGAGR